MKHIGHDQAFSKAAAITNPQQMVIWGEFQMIRDPAPHTIDPQLGWTLMRAMEPKGWKWGQSVNGLELHVFRAETFCLGSA